MSDSKRGTGRTSRMLLKAAEATLKDRNKKVCILVKDNVHRIDLTKAINNIYQSSFTVKWAVNTYDEQSAHYWEKIGALVLVDPSVFEVQRERLLRQLNALDVLIKKWSGDEESC